MANLQEKGDVRERDGTKREIEREIRRDRYTERDTEAVTGTDRERQIER